MGAAFSLYTSLPAPASGFRRSHSGALNYVGTYGYTWSSSPDSASNVLGSSLDFYSSLVYPENNSGHATSFPVRCVQLRPYFATNSGETGRAAAPGCGGSN